MMIHITVIAIFVIIGVATVYISKGHENFVEQEIEDVCEEVIQNELSEIDHSQTQKLTIDEANINKHT